MKPLIALLLAATLAACSDNYPEVQRTDSIEAYEEYLKNNPDSRYKMEATDRLENLYLEKARKEGLPGFDAYLARFPEGTHRTKAMEEREPYLFSWAEGENTKAAWERFLAEYPKAEKDRKRNAEAMLDVHAYLEHLTVGAPVVEQVNLAEDPEGPLDGWKISADVTNNGERSIEEMRLTVVYLNEDGRKVGSREWPVVAPYWKVPIEEEHKQPMKKGTTLTWSWTTGNVPEGWSRQVKVYVSRIKLFAPSSK